MGRLKKQTIHVVSVGDAFTLGVVRIMRQMQYHVRVYDPYISPLFKSLLAKYPVDVRGVMHYDDIPNDDIIVMGHGHGHGHVIEGPVVHAQRVWDIYTWFERYVLRGRKVIALMPSPHEACEVAMLVWLLQRCGEDVGYIVEDRELNLVACGHLGTSKWFVMAISPMHPPYMLSSPEVVVMHQVLSYASQIQAYREWIQAMPSSGVVCVMQTHPEFEDVRAFKKIVDDQLMMDYTEEGMSAWTYYVHNKKVFDFMGYVHGQYYAEAVWWSACVAEALGFEKIRSLSMLQHFSGALYPLRWVMQVCGVDCYEDTVRSPADIAYAWSFGEKKTLHLVLYPTNAMLRGMLSFERMSWGSGVRLYVLYHPKLTQEQQMFYEDMGYMYKRAEEVASAVVEHMRSGDMCVTCSSWDMDFFYDILLQQVS